MRLLGLVFGFCSAHFRIQRAAKGVAWDFNGKLNFQKLDFDPDAVGILHDTILKVDNWLDFRLFATFTI